MFFISSGGNEKLTELLLEGFNLAVRHPAKSIGVFIGFFSFQFGIAGNTFLSRAHFIAMLIGLMAGACIDVWFQKRRDDPLVNIERLRGKRRIRFVRVLFSVMGHIAKADGRVSKDEIKVARGIMAELDLSKDEVDMAIKAFTDGKSSSYPLSVSLYSFYQDFRYNIGLRERFVRVQIQAVLASDGVSRVVDKLLHAMAAQLDIPRQRVNELLKDARIHNSFTVYGRKSEKVHVENPRYGPAGGRRKEPPKDEGFSRQRKNYQRNQQKREYADPRRQQRDDVAEAYILLGVSVADDEKAIKRAYRRLLSQHHPDKVIGNGGGSAEKELANAKTIEIRKAYERICEARGF